MGKKRRSIWQTKSYLPWKQFYSIGELCTPELWYSRLLNAQKTSVHCDFLRLTNQSVSFHSTQPSNKKASGFHQPTNKKCSHDSRLSQKRTRSENGTQHGSDASSRRLVRARSVHGGQRRAGQFDRS